MNHVQDKALFGKQESQESIEESQNQAKISDSRITSTKIHSCRPLGFNSPSTVTLQPYQVFDTLIKHPCIANENNH